MAKARTLTLNTKVNVTGADELRGLGKTLQKTGAALTVGITTPLAALGAVAGRAASDLNESVNAINVVFGKAAHTVEEFGKTAAKSAGLSQRAFNQLVTPIGAALQNIGFNADEAADASVKLAQRAADMASVFNTDVADALGAIQAGLRGEADPLERFGVGLSDAAVTAKALELGLADSAGQLDVHAKGQARLALLMEQTDRVAGDFAATSGEVANQQRIMAAEAENAAAKLGQKFLPIQQKVIATLTAAIDAWSKLPEPVQNASLAFAGVAAAIGPLLAVSGSLVRVVAFLGGPRGIRLLITSLRSLQLATLGPLGAIAALGVALHELGGTTDVPERLGRVMDSLSDVGIEEPKFRDALDRSGLGLDDFNAKMLEFIDAGFNARDALRAVRDGLDTSDLERQAKALEKAGTQWETYQDTISEAMFGTPDGAVPTVAGAVDEMAAEVGEAPGKMADELLAAQFRLTDATTQMVEFMDQALSPVQERFQIQAFLASAELANGLTSNNPLIRQKAEEMQQAAIDRLAEIRSAFWSSGSSAAYAFGQGMTDQATIDFVAGSAARMAAAARGIFPDSEPKDPNSPFRGITRGFGFGEILGKGILTGKSALAGAFRGLVGDGLTMPLFGGGLSPSMASGGTTIYNIDLHWSGEPPQGRTEAEIAGNLKRLSAVWG